MDMILQIWQGFLQVGEKALAAMEGALGYTEFEVLLQQELNGLGKEDRLVRGHDLLTTECRHFKRPVLELRKQL